MKTYKAYLLLLMVSLLSMSCNRDLDVAPVLTFDGKANHTIAELLEYHPIGSLDSYDSIPKGVIISGIVVTSDEHGNIYKYLNIQDSTGGIQIKINNTALYHKYKVGQRVFVRCDGLVLGDYRRLPQLGWWANGAMEPIASNREANYIFRDGLPGTAPAPKVITSVSQIQSRDYNTLVKLEGATFNNGGDLTFSDPYASTSRTITLSGGGTVELRTSNYADFAQRLLPEGTGSIVGILTRYNNTNQLTIRSLDDLSNFGSDQVIYEADLSSNILENGWNTVRKAGSRNWEYIASSRRISITGADGEQNDSWLLSPALNLSSYQDVRLVINHRIPGNLGSNSHMKVYYSIASPSSPFNESDWTELAVSSYPAAFGNTVIDIPNTAVSNTNFRIAFRYNDNRNSNWTLAAITFQSYVSNK